jgi:hypothetical protein
VTTEHKRHVAAARRAGWRIYGGPGNYSILSPDGHYVRKGFRFRETAELAMIGMNQKGKSMRRYRKKNPHSETEVLLVAGGGILVLGAVGYLIYNAYNNGQAASALTSTNTTTLGQGGSTTPVLGGAASTATGS